MSNLTAQELLSALPPGDARRKLFAKFEDTATGEPKKRRSKYNAEKTEVDGFFFDSKRESERYKSLVLLRLSGDVRWFALQATFILAGGVRYRCDFIVYWKDGSVTVEDSKGFRDKVYRLKRKLMKAEGVEIVER